MPDAHGTIVGAAASALAKASGGTLALADSPAGGLAVMVTLPVTDDRQ